MKNRFGLSRAVCSLLVLIAVSCVGVFSIQSAHAQQKFVRGQATESSKEDALKRAKVAAWRNYLGMIEGAKLDNIVANEKLFLDNLDKYLGAVSVVEEKCEGALFGKCTVSIKATINESLIDSGLRQISKAGVSGPSAGAASGDDIAFLLMARVLDEGTRFETKVTKRAEVTVSTQGAAVTSDQSQASRSASVEAQRDEASVTQSSKRVTGGSENVRGDDNRYKPWGNIRDLQNAIQESLNNNKIAPLAWEELMSDCGLPDSEPFSKQYADSSVGDIPTAVRVDVFRKLREDCKSGAVQKMIIAQVEIDGYRTDPGTGLWLATGNVNVNIYDVSRRGRGIGSAKRTLTGRAATKQDAARNALENASKPAADAIINLLNLK
jgi:hypothetical protein